MARSFPCADSALNLTRRFQARLKSQPEPLHDIEETLQRATIRWPSVVKKRWKLSSRHAPSAVRRRTQAVPCTRITNKFKEARQAVRNSGPAVYLTSGGPVRPVARYGDKLDDRFK